MATTTTEPATIEPEDLLKISDRPMPELVRGRLIERELMGQWADAIVANLIGLVGSFADQHRLGLVNGSQGSYQIFPNDPRKVRIPDVSFTRKERLPSDGPARGHSRVAPDLVVEVVSPNDSAKDLQEKIQDFLSAGVPLIWVAHPETRMVLVSRRDGSAQWLQADDQLDGEDILPGFRCKVATLFEV